MTQYRHISMGQRSPCPPPSPHTSPIPPLWRSKPTPAQRAPPPSSHTPAPPHQHKEHHSVIDRAGRNAHVLLQLLVAVAIVARGAVGVQQQAHRAQAAARRRRRRAPAVHDGKRQHAGPAAALARRCRRLLLPTLLLLAAAAFLPLPLLPLLHIRVPLALTIALTKLKQLFVGLWGQAEENQPRGQGPFLQQAPRRPPPWTALHFPGVRRACQPRRAQLPPDRSKMHKTKKKC